VLRDVLWRRTPGSGGKSLGSFADDEIAHAKDWQAALLSFGGTSLSKILIAPAIPLP
jgi:hypothetical protein